MLRKKKKKKGIAKISIQSTHITVVTCFRSLGDVNVSLFHSFDPLLLSFLCLRPVLRERNRE